MALITSELGTYCILEYCAFVYEKFLDFRQKLERIQQQILIVGQDDNNVGATARSTLQNHENPQ